MPTIGDPCCADAHVEGEMMYGVITRIEGDIAYSDLSKDYGIAGGEFGGDVPTRKIDGVWVFDAF